MMSGATDAGGGADKVNRDLYAVVNSGRDDYWRKMAAPRFRVRTILKTLEADPPASLLDLGCGNGQLLVEVQPRFPGIRLAGIDLSAPQIDANRARSPGVGWYVCDLQAQYSVPGEIHGNFDVVVASEIIEHLTVPESFLHNARLLARPGSGRLILSTQSGPLRETERRVGHHRHYQSADIEALLRRTGWSPVRIWNCGFPFHDLSKWWANRHPEASLERFGGQSYGPYDNLVCLALRSAFLLNSRRRGAQLFAVARRSH